MRSSWLTVARKSSFSWSSCRSRSLASRSSAVACSSAATSAPAAGCTRCTCEVSSRIRIRSSGPIDLAAHHRADHHPRAGGADRAGQLALGQLDQGGVGRAHRAPARGRGGAGRPRTLDRHASAPRNRISRPRRAATLASPRQRSADAGRARRRRRTAPPATARALLWRPSRPQSTTRTRLSPRLQRTAWLTGAQSGRARTAPAGAAAPCPSGPSCDEAGVDQAGCRPTSAGPACRPRRATPPSRPSMAPVEIGLLPVEAGHDRRSELGDAAKRDQADADQRQIFADAAGRTA